MYHPKIVSLILHFLNLGGFYLFILFYFHYSILGSCSDLMKVSSSTLFKHISVNSFIIFTQYFSPALLFSLQAIHMLVTAATDLQKDIVEGGRVR